MRNKNEIAAVTNLTKEQWHKLNEISGLYWNSGHKPAEISWGHSVALCYNSKNKPRLYYATVESSFTPFLEFVSVCKKHLWHQENI